MIRYITEYSDIINLPHHISSRRMRMSCSNRAAQFAPFAALTGYDSCISESARYTEERIEPAEDLKSEINNTLWHICRHIEEHPGIVARYFIPDFKKSGGKYVIIRGRVCQADPENKIFTLEDGTTIFPENIISIHITADN